MGEIMDRAVTIFVRNAWLFIALAAILYVPVALTQLSMGDFWSWYMQALSGSMSGKATGFPQELFARFAGLETVQLALLVVLSPVVQGAGIYAASKILLGEPVTLAGALKFALPRWGRILLFVVLWIVAFAALAFGLILGLSFMAVVLGQLHSLAIVITAGLIGLCLFFAALVAAAVSGGVGLVSTVVEDAGAFTAFRLGLERTLNRQFFWRSMLLGLIFFAISIGFSIVGSVAGITLMTTLHSPVPMILANVVVSLAQFGFIIALLVTYYYDLRVRREGVDLSLLAARLAPPAPQSP
jgi:hypothetical protein